MAPSTDAQDTAAAILAHASALLGDLPFDDVSFRVLGDAVGVSERTVYRHFPTRAHLLAGLAERIDVQEMPFRPFTTVPELLASTRERFRAFDAEPRRASVCARAAVISPVVAADPDFLTHALTALVEAELPRLNQRDQRRAVAALRGFASASFWAHARRELGMGADEAADVVDGVVAATFAALAPPLRVP